MYSNSILHTTECAGNLKKITSLCLSACPSVTSAGIGKLRRYLISSILNPCRTLI